MKIIDTLIDGVLYVWLFSYPRRKDLELFLAQAVERKVDVERQLAATKRDLNVARDVARFAAEERDKLRAQLAEVLRPAASDYSVVEHVASVMGLSTATLQSGSSGALPLHVHGDERKSCLSFKEDVVQTIAIAMEERRARIGGPRIVHLLMDPEQQSHCNRCGAELMTPRGSGRARVPSVEEYEDLDPRRYLRCEDAPKPEL